MPDQPVVLELAPLPREQTGPFLLLGLEKDADAGQIEACWAQRVIWARKNQINVPLEDVNWAREGINEREKGGGGDAASLNADTIEGVLRRLAHRYSLASRRPLWPAKDEEKTLAGYTPPIEVPDVDAVRQGIVLPDMPSDFPAVPRLPEQLAQEPLDPWP